MPRANLTTTGSPTGVITLVQKDRFRREDKLGRDYLITLGCGLGIWLQDLQRMAPAAHCSKLSTRVPPDLGAVAVDVRERYQTNLRG